MLTNGGVSRKQKQFSCLANTNRQKRRCRSDLWRFEITKTVFMSSKHQSPGKTLSFRQNADAVVALCNNDQLLLAKTPHLVVLFGLANLI